VVSDNGSGPVVNVERRTGTRLYIQVDGPLVRELAVTDVQTKYNQAVNPLAGSADVTFRIENRGNVVLGGKPTVSVSGPFGIGKQTVDLSEITPLLPGQKVELSTSLDNVPAAFVDFTTVTVNPVAKADVGGVQPAVGKDRFFAPPIAVLLIMLIVFLGFVAWRAYRRHSKGSEQGDPEVEIEVEPDFEPQVQ
jgi:positive regulator of sigma E activity